MQQQLTQHGIKFYYHGCISGENAPTDGILHGRADTVAFSQHTDLHNWAEFLCGLPAMVQNAQETANNLGAAHSDIITEGFE